MILILNKLEAVCGILSNSMPNTCRYYDDMLTENLTDYRMTYEFTVPTNHATAALLKEKTKFVIRGMDGEFLLFKIETIKGSVGETEYMYIYAEAAGLELLNTVCRPTTLTSVNPSQALAYLLAGTGWQAGIIEVAKTATIVFSDYSTVTARMPEYAQAFSAELKYRITMKNGKVDKRYVDTLERRGRVTGKRFTYKKDLVGLTRTVDSKNIFTALIGVGPANEDGIPMTFYDIEKIEYGKPFNQDFVEDKEALQEYGDNGRHLMGFFRDDSATNKMELLTNTYNKLQEVKKPVTTYEVNIVLLGELLGRDWERVRLGDTIGVYDVRLPQAVMINARIQELKISFTDPQKSSATLSDFVPAKTNINQMLLSLQATLNKKGSAWDAAKYIAENAAEQANAAKEQAAVADQNASEAKETATAAEILAGTASGKADAASTAADQAKKDAASAVSLSQSAQTKVDAANKTANDALAAAAKKADLEYVNGQLVSKADKDGVFTKEEVTNQLNSYVSKTTYKTDQDGVVQQLEDHSTAIQQNATAITSKANATTVNAIDGRLQTAESTISQQAGQIQSKVESTTFTTEIGKKEDAITKSNTAPASPAVNRTWLDTSVTPNVLKRWNGSTWVKATPTTAGEVGAYTKSETDTKASTAETNAKKYSDDNLAPVVQRVSTAESTITQQAAQIQSKVESTTFTQEINKTKTYADGKASTAEGNAKTYADGKATTAESNAKTYADGKAATAESNAKTYSDGKLAPVVTRLSTAESTITQQAALIEARVTKEEFNGMEIGGTNLMPNGSADTFTGSEPLADGWGVYNASSSRNQQRDVGRLKGNSLRLESLGSGAGFVTPYATEIVPNETYTVSFWAKRSTAGGVMHLLKFKDASDVETNPISGVTVQADANQWVRVVQSFKMPATAVRLRTTPRLSGSEAGVIFWVDDLQLEKGNKVTDYSPAPADLENRVSTAESTIKQQADQIELRVTKTDFANLSIGGRNIAIGTGIAKTVKGNNTTNQSTTIYDADYSRVAGKEVTISFDVQGDAANGTFVVQWNNTPWGSLTDRKDVSTTKTHYTFTKLQPASGAATGLQIRLDNCTANVTISNLQLELGNKETDYTPAPEDTQQQISSMSSTITQQAGQIALKVDKNGIISTINQSAEQISIDASKLNLTGFVTITELGQDGKVEIHGGNIKAATLVADAIAGGTLTLGGTGKNAVMQLLDTNDEQVAYFDAENRGFSYLYVGDLESPTVVEYGSDDINLFVSDRLLDYTGAIAPDDSNEGTGWTKPLSTVTEALRRIPKYYDGTAVINVAYNSLMYESFEVSGFMGTGSITLSLGSAKFYGNPVFKNNVLDIFTTGGTMNGKKLDYAVVSLKHNNYVRLSQMKVYGNGSSMNYDTTAGFTEMDQCETYGADLGISARYGGRVHATNCKGSAATYGLHTYGGTITGTGTAPSGGSNGPGEVQGGKVLGSFTYASSSGGTMDAQPTTVTLTATNTEAYRDTFSGSWITGELAQGKWSSYGIYRGLWYFAMPNLSGKTILQVRLYMKRKTGAGISNAITANIKAHRYTSRPSGAPSYDSQTTTASFKQNEGKWVTIPSTFYAGLTNNTTKGFGLYINSTSQNYYGKFFSGAKLEITYK